ncbi:MAG: iron hydrogenase [Oligoflexia bacterium]|nr:iron hydrogenase [Oligoflexia bacterium]
MNISRRDFLKYCAFFSASLGLSSLQIGRLGEVLANPTGPSVIWLNGASCSGCSISFLNTINQSTDVGAVLIESINLVFHPELMSVSGKLAIKAILDTFERGNFILVIEGGIPTAYEGKTCILWSEPAIAEVSSNGSDDRNDIDGGNIREVTCEEAVKRLSSRAAHIIALGSCAVFGGVAAAGENPTAIKSVAKILDLDNLDRGKKVISLPGCPVHPDSLVSTLVKILNNETLEVDDFGRPKFIYGKSVHSVCPMLGKPRATTYGSQDKCLIALGCSGPRAKSNCPTRKWNEGVNWCIGAGTPCIACVEENFPAKSPLIKYNV